MRLNDLWLADEDERTDMPIERIAVIQRHLPGLGDERLDEPIMDRVVHIDALHRIAHLAGRIDPATQYGGGRAIDVGVRGNDGRILAAEFQKAGDQALRTGERHFAAVRYAAR